MWNVNILDIFWTTSRPFLRFAFGQQFSTFVCRFVSRNFKYPHQLLLSCFWCNTRDSRLFFLEKIFNFSYNVLHEQAILKRIKFVHVHRLEIFANKTKDPHFIPTFYFVMQTAKFPNGQNWKTARNAPETPRTLKEHNENEVSHLNPSLGRLWSDYKLSDFAPCSGFGIP